MRAPLIALALALAALFVSLAARAQDRSLEYAVKASYIYKLIPFVTWPDSVASPEIAPFVICAFEDPGNLAALVSEAVAGQRVDDRQIIVRRLDSAAAASQCQMMYVGTDNPDAVAAALEAVQGKAVLTVTDGMPPGRPRGIINFVIVADHVRFQIDPEEAQRKGISISSKLLSLAVSAASGK